MDSEKTGLRIERNCKHTAEETSDDPANQTSDGAHQHVFLYSNIQRWAFGSWSVRARGSQVGTSWTDVGRCLNFNMAGRCASCRGTGVGYGLPERETCCTLPVNQLSCAYFLTKWKKCNIVSLFLQIHIVESTIHHSLMRMDSRQRIVSNACKSLIS